MRLDRLLGIVVVLINRRTVKAKELAGIFEVSERTIHRDIAAINQAGIPIVTYPGAGGGIGLTENYRIEQNLLALDDIISVLGALKGLQSALSDQGVAQTIMKIESLVPAAREIEYMERSNQMVIDLTPWGGSEEQRGPVLQLRKAIRGSLLVTFDYSNMEGEVSKRIVEPDRLVLKGHNWYLYGFCQLRSDYRLFRVSRIRSLHVTETVSRQRPPGQETLPLEQNWSGDKLVLLVLRFIPELRFLVEEQFAGAEMELEADGSSVVKLTLPENEWVYGMILSYSDGVEVLEPPQVRDAIRRKIKRLDEKYAAGEKT